MKTFTNHWFTIVRPDRREAPTAYMSKFTYEPAHNHDATKARSHELVISDKFKEDITSDAPGAPYFLCVYLAGLPAHIDIREPSVSINCEYDREDGLISRHHDIDRIWFSPGEVFVDGRDIWFDSMEQAKDYSEERLMNEIKDRFGDDFAAGLEAKIKGFFDNLMSISFHDSFNFILSKKVTYLNKWKNEVYPLLQALTMLHKGALDARDLLYAEKHRTSFRWELERSNKRSTNIQLLEYSLTKIAQRKIEFELKAEYGRAEKVGEYKLTFLKGSKNFQEFMRNHNEKTLKYEWDYKEITVTVEKEGEDEFTVVFSK